MSIGGAKGMLTRLKKLEQSTNATEEMRTYIREAFNQAIAEDRMCSTDGPVVMECAIRWLHTGELPKGLAGEGPIWR
ncbi:hypothetical protein [Pseudomonas aeruginosa]|uniref:hypothetical protein n=1 Tax=Pseudomonas aeruginosa TaxID=287 RepID=UPI000FC438C1|nr:hypothetical protein [Pseudomonas aeruginosa]RUE83781.1 hypothetical protein IPC1150_24610 [Pseudomonas aeruginosa]